MAEQNVIPTTTSTMKRDFSRVVLTLDNVLIPDEKLSETPSMHDGLDKETEIDLRILGCELIQTAGILLKLPQVAMATAQVVFQRFYHSKSFIKHNMEVVAMASLVLASKIEECPRRNRDVVNVFHHIKQVRNKRTGKLEKDTVIHGLSPPLPLLNQQAGDSWEPLPVNGQKLIASTLEFAEKPRIHVIVFQLILIHDMDQSLDGVWWVVGSESRTIHPLVLDQHYINLKNQVIKAERRVLKELGFCVHVKHPHKIIVMYLEVLESTSKRQLVQCAWNYMNDSLRSDVFMRFHPESIACACIYLAARQLKVPLPNSPPWYWLFAVGEDEVQQICLSILRLYARPKPNYEILEKIVEELKKKQQAAKSKARGILSDVDTPNSTSRQNSPKVISPNPVPSLLAAMKKEKERAETEAKRSDNGDAGSDKSDRSNENHRTSSKKRGADHSDRSNRSPSKSGSSGSASSRSRSPSPPSRKRHRSPSSKKVKKQESFGRADKHKKKNNRSRSRSLSRSPVRPAKSKKYRREEFRDVRDHYKDQRDYKDKDFKDRDYYREKDHKDRDYYKDSRDYRDNRDYYKDNRRSHTPEKERHRSRKHRSNGHRDSPVREKMDKHRR